MSQSTDDARALENEALRARWQPISTAPKDGDSILLFKPDERRMGEEIAVAYWGEWPGEGECWIRVGGKPIAWTSMWTGAPVPQGIVTHWQSLPPPPEPTPMKVPMRSRGVVSEPWDGVPDAPSVTGWHWLTFDGLDKPTLWDAERQRWRDPPTWGGLFPPSLLGAEGFAYLGPCLTPAERDEARSHARIYAASEAIAWCAVGAQADRAEAAEGALVHGQGACISARTRAERAEKRAETEKLRYDAAHDEMLKAMLREQAALERSKALEAFARLVGFWCEAFPCLGDHMRAGAVQSLARDARALLTPASPETDGKDAT